MHQTHHPWIEKQFTHWLCELFHFQSSFIANQPVFLTEINSEHCSVHLSNSVKTNFFSLISLSHFVFQNRPLFTRKGLSVHVQCIGWEVQVFVLLTTWTETENRMLDKELLVRTFPNTNVIIIFRFLHLIDLNSFFPGCYFRLAL